MYYYYYFNSIYSNILAASMNIRCLEMQTLEHLLYKKLPIANAQNIIEDISMISFAWKMISELNALFAETFGYFKKHHSL